MFRFDTPTARLRAIAGIEGISYLVLFFVAMPLKYMADMPLAVRIAGSLHGILFVWGGLLVLQGLRRRSKSLGWGAKIFVAALLPFGTFFLDAGLRADDEQYRRDLQAGIVDGPPAP